MYKNRLADPVKAWLVCVAVVFAACMAASPLAAELVSPDQLAELPQLADTGRFDQVLTLLKSNGHGDAQAASLITDLERYEQNQLKRSDQWHESYEKAIEELESRLAEGKLEEALASAVTAHNLAVDPQAMIASPLVKKLVAQTRVQAQAAEDAQDWVEALSLYRALTLLFDDPSLYRDKITRTGRHLRALRLYAPKQLRKLYAARAQRLGEELPDPPQGEEEPWEERLSDIKVSMLRQTLAQAARRHVSSVGYTQMLHSALESLLALVETDGLTGVFPMLSDAPKAKRFHDGLLEMLDGIDARKNPLNFLDAATVIDRITSLNDKTAQLPDRVLVYELSEGATDALDDFSAVIWPNEVETFSRNTQGKFYGVGIQISIRDDQLIVVSPLEDTPAQRAGIKAGDIIATVDGNDTAMWSLDRAVREITGPEGTKVKLGIKRVGEAELIPFVLTRAEIVIESIRGWQRSHGGGWDYFIDRDLRIGYVRLTQFIPQSATDLDNAINQMVKDGPLNGLILDLRFNPGGLLSSAVEVSDRFIASGPIVSTVGSDGKQTSQFRARRDHTHDQLPMVVLINEGSASASEILSGALQDYQRAVIVGTRSFGKGSVQDLFRLSGDKAYLKLTTQYYMLPRGRIIHRKPESKVWGIEPDLVVRMTPKEMADAMELRQKIDVLHSDEELAELEEPPPTADEIIKTSSDPQLEAALLMLKTRLIAHQLALAQK